MGKLSRHTVVVLLIALGSFLGGMSIAVVAFGQSAANPDAGVPLGDFTQTTPARAVTTVATPAQATTTSSTLGSYTSTVPTVSTPSTTKTTAPVSAQTSPARKPKTSSPGPAGNASPPVVPRHATQTGPSTLAFTGGEPIVIAAGGIGFMLLGLGLHLRRRLPASPAA